MDNYRFGYPKLCNSCKNFNVGNTLNVAPYYHEKGKQRIMLIGQDPRIRKNQNRVNCVLMLDRNNSALHRWLNDIFGIDNFKSSTVYATNIVKCTLDRVPSDSEQGGREYLRKFFENCKSHLLKEILSFQPDLILSFGEPAHEYLLALFDDNSLFTKEMRFDFTGSFYHISVKGHHFKYSPCLHIQTYRVAESYGDKVKFFKSNIQDIFKSSAPGN